MESSNNVAKRFGWIVFGLILIAGFYSLDETYVGIKMRFAAPWNNSPASELYFTLGILALVFPGAWFIGVGLSDWLAYKVSTGWARINGMNAKQLKLSLLAVFGAGLTTALVGNAVVLMGYPFTDDEYAARYGGQVLASGAAMEPMPEFWKAVPNLFFFMKDGMIASFDYFGALLPWTFAELTHTENLIFAIFVALGAVGMAGAVGTRLSPAWGALSGLLYLLSPMALSLSVTTHTHVMSRGYIAAALFTLALAQMKSSRLFWALTGILAGGALVTRPLHTLALLSPLLLVVMGDVRKADSKQKQGFALFLLFVVGWGVLMTFHSFAVTDSILPARFAANELTPPAASVMKPPLAFLTSSKIFWNRFGANATYNFFMLVLWGLGPLTLLFAAWGATFSRFTKALAVGIGLHFGLAMLHDVPGIHMVGPIHYSETIVPTLILCVFGLFQLKEWLRNQGVAYQRPLTTLMVGTLIGCALMAHGNLKGLHNQAEAHAFIYGMMDNAKFDNSVVMVPRYGAIWQQHPKFRQTGGLVFEWRKIAPNNADRVVILHNTDVGTMAKIRRAYPDRKFWQMHLKRGDKYLSFTPID